LHFTSAAVSSCHHKPCTPIKADIIHSPAITPFFLLETYSPSADHAADMLKVKVDEPTQKYNNYNKQKREQWTRIP